MIAKGAEIDRSLSYRLATALARLIEVFPVYAFVIEFFICL